MKQGIKCARMTTYRIFVSVFFLGFGFHIPQGWAIECGDILKGGNYKLIKNVMCDSSSGDGPAITLDSDSTLDLNGFAILCNDTKREGVKLQGNKAKVHDGVISGCQNGIVVNGMKHELKHLLVINNGRDGVIITESDNNWIKDVQTNFNTRTGFNIVRSNNNRVDDSSATNNGRQGFKIDGRANEGERMNAGINNTVRNSDAYLNCRDGFEIDDGDDNSLIGNLAVSNGNKAACEVFGGSFQPQFYAGFDVTANSKDNIIKNNRASGNQGCNLESGNEECSPRERNLWDENADNAGCFSSNLWKNNIVNDGIVEPECSPGP